MKCKIIVGWVALIFLSVSQEAWSSGTSVNGVAPRAQSMQSAFTAVADDPSAIYYNSAGLTQIKGTEIDVGFVLILPDMDYNGTGGASSASSSKKAFGVNLFVSTDVTKPVSFGFGFYAPFARTANYGLVTAASPPITANNSSTIYRLDFVPTVAYQVTDWFSLGASFVASYVNTSSDILTLNESGDGYGFTGQLGLLFTLPKRVKIGLNYRGPMSAFVDGTGTTGGVSDNFSSRLRFPGVLSTGVSWQVVDSLLLSAQLDWEMWSYVKQIFRDYSGTIPDQTTILNSKDTFIGRFGILYAPWQSHEFRFGYSYAPATVPANNIVPAQPDYDLHSVSLGYSFYYKAIRLDVGYELVISPTRTSNSPVFPGNYKTRLHNLMLGFAYHFGKPS